MNYENLKKISDTAVKEIELNLLLELDEFCNKHGLKYALDGGTLIGAIRHKGFIPWDDDIDVVMPYPDYLRLIELFKEDGNKYNGELKAGIDAGFHYAKFCDKRTIVKVLHRSDDKLYGVWVDIFPMYSIDDDDATAQKDIDKILFYERRSWRYMGTRNYHTPIRRLYHMITNRAVLQYYFKKIDKVVNKFPYGTTNRIRFTPVVSRKLCPANNDHFDNRIKLEFEGYKFFAPRDYDAYLTGMYGDYMKLPPIDQRINHKIEAYWLKCAD